MDWMLLIQHRHFDHIQSEMRLTDSLNLHAGGMFQVIEERHGLTEE